MQRIAAAGFGVVLAMSVASSARATTIPIPPVRDHGSIAIRVGGHAELRGTVRSVDASAKMITVNVWGTEWRVKVEDPTKLLSRNGAPITVGDIAVGHLVQVVGRADPGAATTIIATRVIDLDATIRRVTFHGSITALAPPDAFTLLRDGGGQLTVKVGTAAKIVEGSAVKTFGDLNVNLRVTVIGTYDLAANALTASEVRIREVLPSVRRVSFRGSITALAPPDAFTLLRDGGGQMTVRLAADAKMTEGDAVKGYGDLTSGVRVAVVGTYEFATNTLTASEVRIRPQKPLTNVSKGRALGKILPKIRGPRN